MSAGKKPKGARPNPPRNLEVPSSTRDGKRSAGSGRPAGPGRSSEKPPRGIEPPAQADVGEIARAVSTAFMIFVIGGLVQPVVGAFVPILGLVWLILIAMVAFGWAGWRGGPAGPNPPLFGGGAAVGSYLLVLPLLFVVGTFEAVPAISTLVAGAVIGPVAGYLGQRYGRPD